MDGQTLSGAALFSIHDSTYSFEETGNTENQTQ